MKKLSIVSLVTFLLILNNANAAIYWINGKQYTCYGSLNVINGRAFCDSFPIDYYDIKSSGITETKKMSIAGVNHINASGPIDITIEHCPTCDEMLTITADKNIMPYLNSTTSKNQLIMQVNSNVTISNQQCPAYHAVVKNLNAISASKGANIKTVKNPLKAGALQINLDNSKINAHINVNTLKLNSYNCSAATIQGITKKQTIHLTNASAYDGTTMKSDSTEISATNASTAGLCTKNSLQYNLTNASSAIEYGNPTASGTTTNVSTMKMPR